MNSQIQNQGFNYPNQSLPPQQQPPQQQQYYQQPQPNQWNLPPGQQQNNQFQQLHDEPTAQPYQAFGMQQQPQIGFTQNDPLSILQNMEGVVIKQSLNVLEIVTGFVQQNRYDVFLADKFGKQISQMPFMKVKEESNCCQRQCVAHQCRGFSLQFYLFQQTGTTGQWIEQLVCTNKKECSCNFFCFNRPVMEIFQNQQNGQELKLGEVRNPFKCCDLIAETYIRNPNNGEEVNKFNVEGSCCQLGFFCQFPCKSCQEMEFSVVTPQGQILTPMKKIYQGLWRACLGTSDYFSLPFPSDISNVDKFLMLAATMMIEYMYFNVKPDQRGDQIMDNF